MQDNKTIFSALKKINQIGKKLSGCGEYILASGMIIKYDEYLYEDQEPNNVSIGIIETSVLKKLDALGYIGLRIDGNELYRLSQEGDFLGFEIDQDSISILFSLAIKDDNFLDDFILSASNAFNMTADEVKKSFDTDFADNIDLHEFYIKFKNRFIKNGGANKSKNVVKKLVCPIIDDNDEELIKVNDIMNNLSNGNLLAHREFNNESSEIIADASRPISMQLTPTTSIRVMRSLYKLNPKGDTSIKIIGVNENKYFITQLNSSGVELFNIYRFI